MRIIAGQWRGRPLSAPKGDATRPTTDRVRESLMSSLNSALCGFEGVVALDAFAGSGALGLEVLSRGGRSVWFYETDRKAQQAIRKNFEVLGLSSPQAVLRACDVMAAPPTNPTHPFHLVMCDPPYAMPPADVVGLIDRLADAGALADDAVVSYEHAKAADGLVADALAASGRWSHIVCKSYGDTAIDLLERKPR